MSEKLFIRTLQALITMVDPESPTSVACMKTAIESMLALAMSSQKVDYITLEMMEMARMQAEQLARCKDDFAGKPGDLAGNNAKQRRLTLMLRPGC